MPAPTIAESVIDTVEHVTPIYFIGDASVLPYGDLSFEESTFYCQRFVTRTRSCGSLAAGSFVVNGMLNAAVSAALAAEGLIDQSAAGWHARHAAVQPHVLPQLPPHLVFMLGSVDLNAAILPQLTNPLTDFALPSDLEGATDYARYEAQKEVEYQSLYDAVARHFAPYFNGLSFLRQLGFASTYVHLLPLPSPTEENANEGAAPLGLAYKTTMLVNAVLREGAQQIRLRVVDPQRTSGGALDRVASSLDAVVRLTLQPFESLAVPSLWQAATAAAKSEQRSEEAQVSEEVRRRFESEAIASLELGSDAAREIRDRLSFDRTVGNEYRRLDWDGNPIKPYTKYIARAVPDEELLASVYNLMYSPAVERFTRSCLGSDYIVAQHFYFRSTPHNDDFSEAPGPQGYHFDGCPPGVMRAIIYLTDVDEESGPFEYIDKSGAPTPAVGPAGTLLIFDANRIKHRGRPPVARHREVLDMVLAPRLPGTPRRIISAGMNSWPIDPYAFSTRGFLEYRAPG